MNTPSLNDISHEAQRYTDQGERFVPKKPVVDGDKWATSKWSFQMFPRYEMLQGILGMTSSNIYNALTGDNSGMYRLAIYRLADIGLKLEKDQLLVKRGLDRVHFKTDAETLVMQQLFTLPNELAKIAVSGSD